MSWRPARDVTRKRTAIKRPVIERINIQRRASNLARCIIIIIIIIYYAKRQHINMKKLECGPMPNVMAALPTTGGALCSTPQFG